jgi:integrase
LLTVRKVQTAKPGRHLDADGLYLEVTRKGTRRFLYRYMSPATHRPTEASCGVYPIVGLADARAKAAEYRAIVKRDRQDPVILKRQAKAADVAAQKTSTTFADALAAYVEAFGGGDKQDVVRELDALMRRHVATLLPRPLATISSNDVLHALACVQAKFPKTAARARTGVATVFGYALARNMFAGSNPASRDTFKFLLPAPPKSTPHRMMPYVDVPAFVRRLRETPSASRLALEFLILTATRTQETLEARWAEIDCAARTWTIAGVRMKMGRDHKIPLSDAAIDVLTRARGFRDSERLVFTGSIKGSCLSARALEVLLHRQLRQPYSVHGFRAAFSTWAHERTDYPHDLIELCLAHEEGRGNAVARAYNRSDAIEKRRALMQSWGDFVTGAASASNVKPLVARAQS